MLLDHRDGSCQMRTNHETSSVGFHYDTPRDWRKCANKRFFWLETSYNRTPFLKHDTRANDVTNGLLLAYHLLGS